MTWTIDGELCRARVYVGSPMTIALAMHYASGRGGLTGESNRFNYPPESFYASRDMRMRMDRRKARYVAALLRKGWIEGVEVTREVPAEPEMFGPGTHPAHTWFHVTYYATEKGRREWSAR